MLATGGSRPAIRGALFRGGQIMSRRWCALIVALMATGWAMADEPKAAPPAIVPAKGPAKPLTAEILIAKLAERVDVERAWSRALEQALDHVTSQLGIPVLLDL